MSRLAIGFSYCKQKLWPAQYGAITRSDRDFRDRLSLAIRLPHTPSHQGVRCRQLAFGTRHLHRDARIGSKQIRLLKVTRFERQKPGKTSLHIWCETKSFSLDCAPPFRAFSYTWQVPYTYSAGDHNYHRFAPAQGDANDHGQFYCNGHATKVGSNVQDALSHLLNENIVNRNDWLWIDAICINQDDMEEKTAQVATMGNLYARATEVLIWLGPVMQGFEKEFADMAALINDFLSMLTEMRVEDNVQIVAPDGTQHSLLVQPDLIEHIEIAQAIDMSNLSERLTYLANFLMHCRWFDRVWTMQELALSAKPRMFCGQHEFSWSELSNLVSFIESVGLTQTLDAGIEALTGSLTYHSMQGLRRMRTVCALRDMKQDRRLYPKFKAVRDQQTSSLYNDGIHMSLLLRHAWDAGCANDHDHVAGILGMATLWCDPRLTEDFMIDYNHSAHETFINTTKTILQKSNSLDALAILPFEAPSMQSNPSWIFRPSRPVCYRGPAFLPEKYAASKGLSISTDSFTINELELICSGYHFDTIRDVANFDPFINSDILPEECLRLGAQLPEQSHARRSRVEIIWRTLLMAEDEKEYPSKHYEPQFWTFIARSFARNAHLKGIRDIKAFECSITTDFEPLLKQFCNGPSEEQKKFTVEAVTDAAKDIFESFIHHHHHQQQQHSNNTEPRMKASYEQSMADFNRIFPETPPRPCTTQKGLFGLGPSHMDAGDQIWVLATGNVPFILRPLADREHYTLVGHGFFLDHMHGEMLDGRYGYNGPDSIRHITIV